MIHEYRLKAEDVRHQTMKTLMNNIPLQVNGYRCTTEMIFDILIKASAESISLDAVCEDLENVAGGVKGQGIGRQEKTIVDGHGQPDQQPDGNARVTNEGLRVGRFAHQP